MVRPPILHEQHCYDRPGFVVTIARLLFRVVTSFETPTVPDGRDRFAPIRLCRFETVPSSKRFKCFVHDF